MSATKLSPRTAGSDRPARQSPRDEFTLRSAVPQGSVGLKLDTIVCDEEDWAARPESADSTWHVRRIAGTAYATQVNFR